MDCEVCELNNIGVCLLVEGRLQEARIVFSKAIGITKRLIQRGKEETAPSTVHAPASFKTVVIPDINRVALDKTGESLALSNGAFVYRRAFLLPHNQPIPTETISTVILFNMALGFHIAGISACSEQYFELARNCYCMTLSILAQNCTTMRPMLSVVLLNNLGEVYYQLCQYDDMTCVCQDLKTLWQTYDAEQHLEESEVQGLLWNMVLLKTPQLAAAA